MITSARLLGGDGEERNQFLAGEPFALTVEIEAREPVAAPLLQLELRDDSGLLIASDIAETAGLGWNGAGRLEATMTVPALPLAFGRFHLRLGLTDATGERLLHWLDDALVFLVYPDSEERGLVRLGGAWHAGANSGSR